MTVHRAKGLEFDTVYLPFLDFGTRSKGSRKPAALSSWKEPPGGMKDTCLRPAPTG